MPVALQSCARCGATTRQLWAIFPAIVTAGSVDLLCAPCEQARRQVTAPPLAPETRMAVAVARGAALFGEEPSL